MNYASGELLKMVVSDIEVEPKKEDYQPLKLITSRGNVECRYYQVPSAQRAAIWVGGIANGWDTPANQLYPQLCSELVDEGISSVRVRYRHSTRLDESVLDVLAALDFLERQGIKAVALTGHSFGGAVAIQAAAHSPTVRTVVTLASQSYGAQPVLKLSPRCSILLLHGTADRVLSPYCSESIYQSAGQPKHLILYEGANHGLEEVAQEVERVVRNWVTQKLNEISV